jgi:hypothetical protein
MEEKYIVQIPPDIEDQIDEIIEYFEWDKVHKAMIALDWKWHKDGGEEVPTLGRIINRAKSLLKDAYSRKSTNGTVGFYATYHPEENYFELIFQLESWSTHKEF